jgi:anti-sigma B factor antagonist
MKTLSHYGGQAKWAYIRAVVEVKKQISGTIVPFFRAIRILGSVAGSLKAMDYKERQVGNITVLDVSGRIDLGVPLSFGEGAGHPLEALVRDFASRGQTKIVLNLHDVAYIDSSGIGDLVASAMTLRRQGGDLRVVNPSMVVQKLLRMTLVDTVLDVKPDEASALAAFSKI